MTGYAMLSDRPQSGTSLDQFDHALCGVGAGAVQKHLGQGVAKFALCAIEVERSYPPRHRMPALTNLSR